MRRFCALFLVVLFASVQYLVGQQAPTPHSAPADAPAMQAADQASAPQAAPSGPAPAGATPAAAQDKPRIFVTDEPLHEGDVVVRGRAAAGHVESGPNARVVEIQADLVKVCPHVTVTNRQDMADFTLLFRRQGGKRSAMFAFGGLAGLALSATSKVDGASLFAANGDLVMATRQRTVENAIREICTSIPMTIEHVAQQPVPAPNSDASQPTAAQQPEPAAPPAPTKTISLGQTRDEVVAILGPPQKVVKLLTKEMLYYPDMKVILVEQKVVDVR